MKKSFLSLSLLGTLFTTAVWANGEKPYPIVEDSYSQDCDVSVEWDSYEDRILFEFDDHFAHTDLQNGIRFVNDKCKVKVPIYVPEGYRVAVGSVELAYDYQVPEGGQGYTTLRYSLAGQVDLGVAQSFEAGNTDTDIIVYHPDLKWSRCGRGETVEFELRSKVVAKSGYDADTLVSYENGAGTFKTKYPKTKIICGVVYQRC